MAYDVNGLERTINALETSFIGFRFYDTVSPGILHQVPDALSRIISPQGNDDRPVNDEVPTYGDHENVLLTTRTRKPLVNDLHEPAIPGIHENETEYDNAHKK